MSPASASAEKTERLLNLVLALKSARRPVSKQRIREALPAYAAAPSADAFDRMFERDKDELREMGIPITTTVVDVLFDDEVGYRIDASEASLPPISFEPEEVAALALAARAWSTASMSGAASAGLRKLRLAGVEIDESTAAGIEPRIRTTEAAFDDVRAAVTDLQPITFDYRRNDGVVSTRRVQPWSLHNWRGRWYLTGYDLERDHERAFRLSRFEGSVMPTGRARSYVVPPDHVPVIDMGGPGPEVDGDAVVRVRQGRGHGLRRRALDVHQRDQGWDEVRVPYLPGITEAEVVALGAGAIAVSPQSFVDHVRADLLGVARANSVGARADRGDAP